MKRTTVGARGAFTVLGIVVSYLVSTSAVCATETAAVRNPQIAAFLSDAKNLSAKKQWSGALAAVKKAQAVPKKSVYEEYKIDEFMAYLLTQQGQHSEAASVFEQLANSKNASPRERADHRKTAAQLYFQAKDYPRAEALARQAAAQRSDDAQLLELLGQSEYLSGNFKNAADTLQQLLTVSDKERTKPKESWLQMLLNAYDRLQDRPNASAIWEELLRHYPKPEYWRAVLSVRTAGRQLPAIELGYQRLMFDLGMLTDPADFEELAMGAIDEGAPGEAVRVLQAGFQQGIFAGREERRFRRMLDYAKKEAGAHEVQLDELRRNAQRASTGQISIALGRLHFGEGRYDEAVDALEQGLRKGELSDPTQGRIELGIALLKNHQVEQAREVFDAVKEAQWRGLAELWSLRAAQLEQSS
jgi:tetratricopeptide (TPR) repeat protein